MMADKNRKIPPPHPVIPEPDIPEIKFHEPDEEPIITPEEDPNLLPDEDEPTPPYEAPPEGEGP